MPYHDSNPRPKPTTYPPAEYELAADGWAMLYDDPTTTPTMRDKYGYSDADKGADPMTTAEQLAELTGSDLDEALDQLGYATIAEALSALDPDYSPSQEA